MPFSSVSLSSASPSDVEADVLVLAVAPDGAGVSLLGPGGSDDFAVLAGALPALGVRGGEDELTRVQADGIAASSIALIGCPPRPLQR